MKIYSVHDKEFKNYGRVISIDASSILQAAEKVEMPQSGTKYVPSLEEFEKLPIKQYLQDEVFGQVPMQLGYCWGWNDTMNALEWHTSSEINIATEDLVLIVGDIRMLEDDHKYNSENVMMFEMKKGETIEMYATTLHYCPINRHKQGFGSIVGLPLGTNTPLDRKPDDKLLFAKNKWLIGHVDNEALKARGVHLSIYGENHKL